jgi:uncharacterized protein YbbK (DUF523 family)
MSKARPVIAISSCLLGNAVRYDGQTKFQPQLCEQFQQHFELLAVCPEVEIGLSVPRPPVQLTLMVSALLGSEPIFEASGITAEDIQQKMTLTPIKLIGRDDASIDITERMRAYCNTKPDELEQICGYVFKSKSPSCGLHDVPLFAQGKMILSNHRGLFAQAMTARWPDLPVADELQLNDAIARAQFIRRVLDFQMSRHR